VDKKDFAAARSQLQWAYDHASDDATRHIALLRLARVILAQGDAAAAMQVIANVDEGVFAAQYEELKGDIYIKQGKKVEAYTAYQKALAATSKAGQGSPTLQLKLEGLPAPGKQETRS
jgi:predicted negative regulator of RcsB-dependent stress response